MYSQVELVAELVQQTELTKFIKDTKISIWVGKGTVRGAQLYREK